jgi:hypothetical protein
MTYVIGDPSTFTWGANYPGTPMPPEDELRSQRNGRFILILRYIILGAYILYAARRNSLPYSALGIYFRHFFPLTLIGVVAGLLFLSLRKLATSVWPTLVWNNPTHPITKGPVSIWVVIILIGGFAEELWRAFCLIGLQNDGLQTGFVVLLTSAVFAASQVGGKPTRISGNPIEVFSTAAIGMGLAILFLRFDSFLLVGSANITYYLATLYFVRTRTTHTVETNHRARIRETFAPLARDKSVRDDRATRTAGQTRYGRKCPICNKPVELQLINYSTPFRCQNCDAMLCISSFYAWLTHGSSITLTALILWRLLHMEFLLAAIGGLILGIPLRGAVRFLIKPFVPLEASDVVR